MMTKYESINGVYSLCAWLDEHYGKIEIIAITQPTQYSSYQIFYREITQQDTNGEQ